jgi:hypothetical protein
MPPNYSHLLLLQSWYWARLFLLLLLIGNHYNTHYMTYTNPFALPTEDNLIEYKGRYYTGTDIEAMREWLSDCQWQDLEPKDIDTLTDREVLAGINRHVEGGLAEFIANMC